MQIENYTNLKLTYFDFKGRAEPIRLLFTIGNIQFQDKRITGEQFMQLKQQNAFKYDQLPVLQIGEKQFGQSAALVRYAAKLVGLIPEDPIELLKAEQMYGNLIEIADKVIESCFLEGEKQQNARKELVEKVFPKWFGYIEKELVENGQNGFCSGNSLSFADIYLYNYVDWYQSGVLNGIPQDILKNYTNVQKVYQNVLNLPQILNYNQKLGKK